MDERQAEEQLLAEGLDRVADVARYLKISTAQVYVLLRRGELPFTRIGRCRRVPHRAVVALAARNLVNVANARA
jgi:excisionase family DNA binding protein